MRMGKFTQTAWQRSVRRQLRTKREEVAAEPSPWTDCSVLGADRGTKFLWADACISGTDAKTGFYAVLHAAGSLAAKGCAAAGASVRVLLPEWAEESLLRDIAGEAERACEKFRMQITAFQGEVTCMAAQPMVSVCAAGTVPADSNACAAANSGAAGAGTEPAGRAADRNGKPAAEAQEKEKDLLLCGYAGLEGTLRLLAEARADLAQRFTGAFLDQAASLENELVAPEQLLAAWRVQQAADGSPVPVTARQIGSGGILAALWELSEQEKLGFEIDMRSIALKQETVEFCEACRLNPYQMTSAGSFLLLTDRAEEVLGALAEAGAHGVRLGTARRQNARVIRNGEETRYLDRPAPDEFLRWQAERDEIRISRGKVMQTDAQYRTP